MKQILNFTKLLFVMQKKNTLFGFIIGLFPALITSVSIEFFIGRLIGFGDQDLPVGFKSLNVLFFFLISQSLSLSLTSLTKYKKIVKNSYLKPDTIIYSEIILQCLNFIILFLLFSIIFNFTFLQIILISLVVLILIIYITFLSLLYSALAVIIDDFNRILGIILQITFWLSPIIYTLRDVTSSIRYIIMCNPFNLFYELVYLVFLPEKLNANILYLSFSSTLIFSIVCFLILNNLKSKIALFL